MTLKLFWSLGIFLRIFTNHKKRRGLDHFVTYWNFQATHRVPSVLYWLRTDRAFITLVLPEPLGRPAIFYFFFFFAFFHNCHFSWTSIFHNFPRCGYFLNFSLSFNLILWSSWSSDILHLAFLLFLVNDKQIWSPGLDKTIRFNFKEINSSSFSSLDSVWILLLILFDLPREITLITLFPTRIKLLPERIHALF